MTYPTRFLEVALAANAKFAAGTHSRSRLVVAEIGNPDNYHHVELPAHRTYCSYVCKSAGRCPNHSGTSGYEDVAVSAAAIESGLTLMPLETLHVS